MPEVSIITPAFNSSATIARCIHSVQSQTFEDWEHIIVDDKSGDETIAIVRTFSDSDPRVRVIALPSNSGAGPARNTAIESARGRYIAFLDADDEWYSEKLEKVLKRMKEGNIAFAYHDYDVVDENGSVVASTCVPRSMGYSDLLRNTAIGCLTVVLDTKTIVIPKMPAIPVRQPLVVWLKIMRGGVVAKKVEGRYAAYHRTRGSISSNKMRAVAWTWRVYREYEGLPYFAAARLLISYAFNSLMKNRGWQGLCDHERP